MTLEPVELGPIIAKQLHNLEVTERKPIDLTMDGKLPRVSANHLHLSQIVANLLSNSVESMAAAQVERMHVVVSWRDDGDTIEVTLADNGEGATPALLVKAFERGFSTRDHKSGGMGLHWSANAARAMGGSLALDSDGPGRGARARLRLPAALVNQAEEGTSLAA